MNASIKHNWADWPTGYDEFILKIIQKSDTEPEKWIFPARISDGEASEWGNCLNCLLLVVIWGTAGRFSSAMKLQEVKDNSSPSDL
jgi:hypothetical protein